MQPKTKLADRNLWWDGVSEVTPAKLEQFLIRGLKPEQLAVTELSPEVQQFNQVSSNKLGLKTELAGKFPPDWKLPDGYKYMDVDKHLAPLVEQVEQDELYEKRLARLAYEIALFKEQGLYEVLRVLIYVLDTFRKGDVVWGVGRGSSCSSYLLYLLGLHDVDPVKYDIDIHDFLKRHASGEQDAKRLQDSAR